MGKIARCSIEHEELFYHLFGVNAEIIIDHAWGVGTLYDGNDKALSSRGKISS